MKLSPIAILRRRPEQTLASSPKRDRIRPLVTRAASMLGLALIAALALFASEVWAQKPPVAEKPLNLTGQVVAGGIQLNWEPPAARAAEVDGYQVYRRRPDQGETLLLVLVANTGSTATSYLDATATEPGVSYIYRVRARRGTELSRMANKLQLTYTPRPSRHPSRSRRPPWRRRPRWNRSRAWIRSPRASRSSSAISPIWRRHSSPRANWTAGPTRSTHTASRSTSRRSWAWVCANRRPTPTCWWLTRRASSCARRARRARPTSGSR